MMQQVNEKLSKAKSSIFVGREWYYIVYFARLLSHWNSQLLYTSKMAPKYTNKT